MDKRSLARSKTSSSSSFRLRCPSLNSLRLRRIFDLFDRNHDGVITVEEINQALQVLGLDADLSELESTVKAFLKPEKIGLEFDDFEALHRSLNDTFFGFEAIDGCSGVFHVATPMDFESKDPENEVIRPTINGVLSIIGSCAKAKTVKRLVFTSSAGTVDVREHPLPVYDETNWSDLDFIYSKKMTGWMYFVSKILAEKAAWEAAKENNIDFISIIPTLVVGPFIGSAFPPSLITALSPITGNESHYGIIKQGQYIHVDDLCEAHIFLFEHPEAEGRYICSSHDATIHDLAKMLREIWPEYNVPTELKGIEKDLTSVSFSSKKLVGMGFQFKYSLEDMFRGAIESSREKGMLPLASEPPAEKIALDCPANGKTLEA